MRKRLGRIVLAGALVWIGGCNPDAPQVVPDAETNPEPEVVDYVQDAVWSPRGDRLLTTWNQGSRFRLYGVMAPDTTDSARDVSTGLRLSDGPDTDGSWSPNGLWVAFASTRDGNGEIYRMRPDGMQPENLTNDPAEDSEPEYSPDGRTIAFISDRSDGVPRLHLMDADGSNVRLIGGAPGAAHRGPTWSPDGQRIALSIEVEEGDFVHLTTPMGGWGRVKRGTAPAWGPDSDVLYHVRNDSLYAARVSTNGLLALGIEGFAPRPSPDGKWLAFVRGEWPESALYAVHLDSNLEVRLTR